MRALTLDYRYTDRFWHWTGMAVLFLALAGALQLGIYYRSLALRTARLEMLIARIEHKLQPEHAAPLTTAEAQQLGAEINHANDVLLQLNLPWDKLFKAVESSTSDGIALLGIEPDSKKGQVKISGEAKNFTALLGYIRTLQASDALADVYLLNHQIQEQDPEKPIHFTLDASWTAKR